MPVGEHAPDKSISRVRGIIESIGFDRARRLRRRRGRLAKNPAVERFAYRRWIETLDAKAAIHLGKARGVPEFGREVTIAFDPGFAELDVPALRRHRGECEAQGIGAETVDEVERVDDVALRLRHLRALLIADEGVDVDVVERDLLHEMEAHHHHPRDPEKDDVEPGDERVSGVKALDL